MGADMAIDGKHEDVEDAIRHFAPTGSMPSWLWLVEMRWSAL
jgi:hypothetical protein